MRQQIETYCVDHGLDVLFMDGHDNAIIGLATKFTNPSILYSKKIILENLCKDMEYDDAIEFFSFNIEGAYVGDSTPVIFDDTIEY